MTSRPPRLIATDATLAYADRVICPEINVTIPTDRFTVIIGPNACGKSTLLKALVRLLAPQQGQITLDGRSIHTTPTKEVARALGLLPQSPTAPDAIRVIDLVARGRYPHQRLFQAWSTADAEAVSQALAATGTTELSARFVDELSGGQRQRVWMAVALAQQTEILLLDEPTTYLDVAHQVELLELCRRLNRERGHTIVAVLHDLNQACRYADHMIVMKQGEIIATGTPHEVISAELLAEVFALPAQVMADPQSGTPLIIPLWQHAPHTAAVAAG